MHEDYFRLSKDPITQRVWKERIEPYIDDPVYKVILWKIYSNIVSTHHYTLLISIQMMEPKFISFQNR